MRVTLLGTGCPIADVHRYGPATLVEAGGEAWLVDCGSGVTQRLLAHGLNGARITGLLLTHLHSDHTVDFYPTPYFRVASGQVFALESVRPARRTRAFFEGLLHAWEPSSSNAWLMNSVLPPGYKQEITEIDGTWCLETEHLRIAILKCPTSSAGVCRALMPVVTALPSRVTQPTAQELGLAQGVISWCMKPLSIGSMIWSDVTRHRATPNIRSSYHDRGSGSGRQQRPGVKHVA